MLQLINRTTNIRQPADSHLTIITTSSTTSSPTATSNSSKIYRTIKTISNTIISNSSCSNRSFRLHLWITAMLLVTTMWWCPSNQMAYSLNRISRPAQRRPSNRWYPATSRQQSRPRRPSSTSSKRTRQFLDRLWPKQLHRSRCKTREPVEVSSSLFPIVRHRRLITILETQHSRVSLLQRYRWLWTWTLCRRQTSMDLFLRQLLSRTLRIHLRVPRYHQRKPQQRQRSQTNHNNHYRDLPSSSLTETSWLLQPPRQHSHSKSWWTFQMITSISTWVVCSKIPHLLQARSKHSHSAPVLYSTTGISSLNHNNSNSLSRLLSSCSSIRSNKPSRWLTRSPPEEHQLTSSSQFHLLCRCLPTSNSMAILHPLQPQALLRLRIMWSLLVVLKDSPYCTSQWQTIIRILQLKLMEIKISTKEWSAVILTRNQNKDSYNNKKW